MRESVEQVLAAYQALGLEALRRGLEWRGPCPACGGNDRWHVKGARRRLRDGLPAVRRLPGHRGRARVGATRTAGRDRHGRHGCGARGDSTTPRSGRTTRRRTSSQSVRDPPGAINTSPPARVRQGHRAGLAGQDRRAGVGLGWTPVDATDRARWTQAVPRWRADGGRSRGHRAVRLARATVARRGAGNRPVGAAALSVRWACRTASSSASRRPGSWSPATAAAPDRRRPRRERRRGSSGRSGPGARIGCRLSRATPTTSSEPAGPARWPGH